MKGKAVKFLVLHLVFCVTSIAYAQEMRKIDVGKLQARVFDDGIQSATNLPMSHCIYPRGSWIDPWDYINTNTYWPGGLLRQAATLVASRNWTDTLSNF